jgi:hypothetical protein
MEEWPKVVFREPKLQESIRRHWVYSGALIWVTYQWLASRHKTKPITRQFTVWSEETWTSRGANTAHCKPKGRATTFQLSVVLPSFYFCTLSARQQPGNTCPTTLAMVWRAKREICAWNFTFFGPKKGRIIWGYRVSTENHFECTNMAKSLPFFFPPSLFLVCSCDASTAAH